MRWNKKAFHPAGARAGQLIDSEVTMLRVHELWKLAPGKYFDSGRKGVPGLMLWVKEPQSKPTSRRHNRPSAGGRSWVVRFNFNDKRPELGIGSLRDTPLSKAREIAMAIRQEARA